MNEQFTNLSIKLTKKLSSKEKKKNGIYFTPKIIINSMIEKKLNTKKKKKRLL